MTLDFFEQLLIILCGSVLATTLFRRINLPPLLAYLCVGALIGPYAVGIIQDVHSIELLSELGVVFLLFMLGLEFSLTKMMGMRRAVFGLGSLQVACTSLALVALSLWFDLPLVTALVIAGALSLSSTAIVSRELIQRNELETPHGQLSVGTLIFQDLAAVFFLILLPALGGSKESISASHLALMLLEGACLLIALLFVGRVVIPALFHESASSGSSDVFVLTSLAAALLAAWLTHEAGLSMALGGFLAGMMLGESHFRYQLEADIRPFRDLLLGLFFVSVGMQLDVPSLIQNWYWVILLTIALIVIKTLLISIIGTLLHRDPLNAIRAGLSLSQGGEFGFALIALALSNQLISSDISSVVVATIIVSMILTPILMNHTHRLAQFFPHPNEAYDEDIPLPAPTEVTQHLDGHIIICGFGRVGQVIARFLDKSQLPYIVIDNDPVRVHEAYTAGVNICFGDAKREELISAIGGDRARLLILSFPDNDQTIYTLKHLRSRFHDLPILVRTRDDSELEQFQKAGATEVIPEALEGSLMMVSHVLSLLQIPQDEIKQQIGAVRNERYKLMHGYFHGSHSSKVDQQGKMKEILHPVPLQEHSYANGKTLQQLKLDQYQISVAMIRREDHSEHAPTAATQLNSGDIVILQGPSDRIDIGEAILLIGR